MLSSADNPSALGNGRDLGQKPGNAVVPEYRLYALPGKISLGCLRYGTACRCINYPGLLPSLFYPRADEEGCLVGADIRWAYAGPCPVYDERILAQYFLVGLSFGGRNRINPFCGGKRKEEKLNVD